MLNPFVLNAPFLYPLKMSENLTVFRCFQGVEKGCNGSKWVNLNGFIRYCLLKKTWQKTESVVQSYSRKKAVLEKLVKFIGKICEVKSYGILWTCCFQLEHNFLIFLPVRQIPFQSQQIKHCLKMMCGQSYRSSHPTCSVKNC